MFGAALPWRLIALAGAVLAALVTIGIQYADIERLKAAISEQKAVMAQDRTNAALMTVKRQEQYREEEQRRAAAQQEALDAAETRAARERADRIVADAAAGRLQQRLDAIVRAAREAAANPALAAGGAPAADATGVLADVLGRCVQRVRLLADLADQRGRAGELCERSYDSLTVPLDRATEVVPPLRIDVGGVRFNRGIEVPEVGGPAANAN